MKNTFQSQNSVRFDNTVGFTGENNLRYILYNLLGGDTLHFHRVVELGICISGSGYTETDGNRQNFRKGDIIIIPPFCSHKNIIDEKEECIWKWSFIDCYALAKKTGNPQTTLTDILQRISFYGIIHKDEYPELYNLLDGILNRESIEKNPEFYIQKIYSMLMLSFIMMTELKKTSDSQKRVTIPKRFSSISDALVYVNAKISAGIQPTAAELAQECNMPDSTFRRVFGEVMGISPKKYIADCAVQHARMLLLTDSKSITEIAGLSGFYEISTFNRAFRAHFGISPQEYRARAKEIIL